MTEVRTYSTENLTPGEEMDQEVQATMKQFDLTYSEATAYVLENNKDLAARYMRDGSTHFGEEVHNFTRQEIQDAGQEIDVKTKKYMLMYKTDYVSALRQVILEEPALAERAFAK